jgi:hypothetical protein
MASISFDITSVFDFSKSTTPRRGDGYRSLMIDGAESSTLPADRVLRGVDHSEAVAATAPPVNKTARDDAVSRWQMCDLNEWAVREATRKFFEGTRG